MDNARIVRIEAATLIGQRPRAAGNNARLGSHGIDVRVPLLRVSTDDGASGFGLCNTDMESARLLLGAQLSDLMPEEGGLAEPARAFDFPLWDLLGRRMGQARLPAGSADGRADRRAPARALLRYIALYERPAPRLG